MITMKIKKNDQLSGKYAIRNVPRNIKIEIITTPKSHCNEWGSQM
jgi:hypothetical protein